MVAALLALDKEVGVISGGLEIPVGILAAHLGIPSPNVHAVPLIFDERGDYRDFDHGGALWRNRGKVEVLAKLPPTHRPVLYMGDGITDLEAQGTVDLFVGFGGVALRREVKERAEAWVEGPSLSGVLKIGLTDSEKRQLGIQPRFAELMAELE